MFATKREISRYKINLFIIVLFYLLIATFIFTVIKNKVSGYSERVSVQFIEKMHTYTMYHKNITDFANSMISRYKHKNVKISYLPDEIQYSELFGVHGVNINEDSISQLLNGTMQSVTPLNNEMLLIATSLEKVLSKASRKFMEQDFRHYFFSSDMSFFYSYEKIPVSSYSIQTIKNKVNTKSLNQTDDDKYLSYLLNPKAAYIYTPVYNDTVSGIPTITLKHVIYDHINESLLGTLYLDFSFDYLRSLFKNHDSELSHFLHVGLHDKIKDNYYEILPGSRKSFVQSLALSPRYDIRVAVDYCRFLISSQGISYLLAVLMVMFCFAFTIFAYRRSFKRLIKNAITDQLTGTYNRTILEIVSEKINFNESFIAVIDCNDFKKINDDFGHESGDHALIYLANSMQKYTSLRDYLIRLGGDEFAILFTSSSSEEEIENCFYNIKKDLSEYPGSFSISISYGYAHLKFFTTISAAMHKADLQMYANKAVKKNR